MTEREDIRGIIERLVQNLEGSRTENFRTPVEIAIKELELTDISERILDEINSGLVNFKLKHHMVSAEYVNT